MKLMYVVALGAFMLGLTLLLYSVGGEDEVNLLGLAVHSRITKGLGLITMIFSVITFLAVYGGMSAPPPREKPRG
jgi:hypothetical protein